VQQHHAALPPTLPLPLQYGSSSPVSPKHHDALHGAVSATAGPYSADFRAAPPHATTGGQYEVSCKQQLDSIGYHAASARQPLVRKLDELWETAYNVAKHDGILHKPAVDFITQSNRDGKMTLADIAEWINRQRAGSGYTLLHQIAWHGGYDRHKHVRAPRASRRGFVADAILSCSSNWVLTKSCSPTAA
jgi:hypothetical protein